MVVPACENQAPCTNVVEPVGAAAALLKPVEPAKSPRRGLKRRAEEPVEARSEVGDGGAGVPAASPAKRARVTEWLAGLVQAARERLRPTTAVPAPPVAPAAPGAAATEEPSENPEKKVATVKETLQPQPENATPAEGLTSDVAFWQFHVEQAAEAGDDDVAHFLGSSWPATAAAEAEVSEAPAEDEETLWVIVDKDDLDVFRAVDSDEIIGTLQKGQTVQVAGASSIVDEYEMIPIMPTGAVQADFVRWPVGTAAPEEQSAFVAGGDAAAATPSSAWNGADGEEEAATEDIASWQWHMESAAASGAQDVATFLSYSWPSAGAEGASQAQDWN
jgi:hypothetical protein